VTERGAGAGTGEAEPAAPDGRSRRHGLGIQSKLLIMLLSVSIASTVVVGLVGYGTGTESLRDAATDRLTEVRQSRSVEVARFFEQLSDASVLYTRGQTTVQAAREFSAGFAELQSSTLTPAQDQALTAHYENIFVPELEAATGEQAEPDVFIPTGGAQRYLQSTYTVAAGGDEAVAIAMDDAGDGSAWSAASAKYNDFFRELVERSGYEDALILDTEGNVVFAAVKDVDLGTNVRSRPYENSNLASAYERAIGSNTINEAYVSDFERYQPSLGAPAAWVTSTIGAEGEVFGVLALQVPIARVNEVMTGEGGWSEDGLGETGEVYLAGSDRTMRSVSRLLLEDPEEYRRRVVAAGTPPDVVDREIQVRGSILLQPVDTEAVDRALQGETGTAVVDDYTGVESFVAYAPIEIEGLQWVIVAKIDSSEALAPVNVFARNLMLSIAAIILVVSLLSLVLAQVFTRPLRRLVTGVQGVATGDLGAQVVVRTHDEIGDLTVAFNDMSRSLQVKNDLLEQQQEENQKLLLSLMPASMASRYREGEEIIADDHTGVAVVYAEITGFPAMSATFDAARSLAMLNDIVCGFDAAADRLGVDRVRTLHRGYLASCGLIVPRVDSARRAVDLAAEMIGVLDLFNVQHGTGLSLRAGVDVGAVSSGLVGRSSLVYDLWGDAVNLAYQVGAEATGAGVFVSPRVYDDLRDTRTFVEAGTVVTASGSETVWALVLDADR